jgi:hypothetical protein
VRRTCDAKALQHHSVVLHGGLSRRRPRQATDAFLLLENSYSDLYTRNAFGMAVARRFVERLTLNTARDTFRRLESRAVFESLFGDFGQFIIVWLTKATGSPLAPTYYAVGGLALSIFALAGIPGMRHADLDARRKHA